MISGSRRDDKQCKAKDGFIKQLEASMDKHSMYKWAGFSESSSHHQYICESFFFYAEFDDGTKINAEGSSSFPDCFMPAGNEIFKLFVLAG